MPDLRIEQLAFGDPGFAICFAIRLEVFVHEQNVPAEEERDEYDETALHFLAFDGQTPLGTARVLLKPGGVAKITRVAVKKFSRGMGVGAALMRHIEQTVPAAEYWLDGQTQARPFYEGLGYLPEGAEFMEAGIPHFHMRKTRRHLIIR
jgi:predicted GNAT family N-acyltransferase